MQFVIFIVAVALLSLWMSWYITRQEKKEETGSDKINEIAAAIEEGVMSFLMREYKTLIWFIILMGGVIWFFLDNAATPEFNEAPWTAVAFVAGSVISILAGFLGMKIATKANVRTANAARKSLSKAFDIAFKSGTVDRK